jgi:hypothetical protein
LDYKPNPTNTAPFARIVIDIPEIYWNAINGLSTNAKGKVFNVVLAESEPENSGCI